jgi:hypothetical protein
MMNGWIKETMNNGNILSKMMKYKDEVVYLHNRKAHRGSGGKYHSFLTLTLDGEV